MVSTPVIHLNTWITTHSPTSEGWKAELANLVIADSLPTKWSSVNHRSKTG